jgi:hypothetical protein
MSTCENDGLCAELLVIEKCHNHMAIKFACCLHDSLWTGFIPQDQKNVQSAFDIEVVIFGMCVLLTNPATSILRPSFTFGLQNKLQDCFVNETLESGVELHGPASSRQSWCVEDDRIVRCGSSDPSEVVLVGISGEYRLVDPGLPGCSISFLPLPPMSSSCIPEIRMSFGLGTCSACLYVVTLMRCPWSLVSIELEDDTWFRRCHCARR